VWLAPLRPSLIAAVWCVFPLHFALPLHSPSRCCLSQPLLSVAAVAVCCSRCCLLQSCLSSLPYPLLFVAVAVSACFRVFPCAVPLYLAIHSLCLGTHSLYLSMQSLCLGTQILDDVALPWYVFGFIERSVRSEVRCAFAPLCVCV